MISARDLDDLHRHREFRDDRREAVTSRAHQQGSRERLAPHGDVVEENLGARLGRVDRDLGDALAATGEDALDLGPLVRRNLGAAALQVARERIHRRGVVQELELRLPDVEEDPKARPDGVGALELGERTAEVPIAIELHAAVEVQPSLVEVLLRGGRTRVRPGRIRVRAPREPEGDDEAHAYADRAKPHRYGSFS